MIVKVNMKNVIPRGKTYYFRLRVPRDCVTAVGKTEITLSLKTEDALRAHALAEKLKAKWAARFEAIREPDTPTSSPMPIATESAVKIVKAFHQTLLDRMETGLAELYERSSDEDLRVRSEDYGNMIAILQNNSGHTLDLPEIDIHWPLKPTDNHQVNRLRKKALIDVVQRLKRAVDEMLGNPVEEQSVKHEATPAIKGQSAPTKLPAEGHDILEVAELMLSAKKRIAKTEATVRTDIRLLQEWTGNKKDITAYSKKDMIDFVQKPNPAAD